MNDEINVSTEKHKYHTHRDLYGEFYSGIKKQFEPFFRSYRVDKVAFCIQVANLVLVSMFFVYVLKDPIEKFTRKGGYAGLGLNVMVVVLLGLLISALLENKLVKWQTIFDMNRRLSSEYLIIFILLNLFSYWGKFFYKTAHASKTLSLDGKKP